MTYLYITAGTILFFAIAGQILKRYFRGSVVWTIKKGNHYTSFWLRTLTWIMWIGCWNFNKKQMSYTVTWDRSAVYNIGPDQKDWNKLPSFQSGFNKLWRELLAWRYLGDTVETTWYEHDRSAKPNYGEAFDQWRVAINGEKVEWNTPCTVRNPGMPWVTPLFPYMGGTQPAQHDTRITISNMEVI